MKPARFHQFRQRDQHCYHCGEAYDLIPHHRSNRGMGGAKSKDQPSNIIVMCAVINDQMESNATTAQLAREYGWKISRYENSLIRPVYDAVSGFWFRLDDDFGRQSI